MERIEKISNYFFVQYLSIFDLFAFQIIIRDNKNETENYQKTANNTQNTI